MALGAEIDGMAVVEREIVRVESGRGVAAGRPNAVDDRRRHVAGVAAAAAEAADADDQSPGIAGVGSGDSARHIQSAAPTAAADRLCHDAIRLALKGDRLADAHQGHIARRAAAAAKAAKSECRPAAIALRRNPDRPRDVEPAGAAAAAQAERDHARRSGAVGVIEATRVGGYRLAVAATAAEAADADRDSARSRVALGDVDPTGDVERTGAAGAADALEHRAKGIDTASNDVAGERAVNRAGVAAVAAEAA